MTVNEMIENFGFLYTQEINANVPGWESPEILVFLNKAQEDVVNTLYNARQFDKINELFVTEVFITPDLVTYQSIGGSIENAVALKLDTLGIKYNYYVDSWSVVTRTKPEVTNGVVCNKPVLKLNSSKFAETVFNHVWFEKPVVFEDFNDTAGTLLVVIYDSYVTTLDEVRLEYLKIAPVLSAGGTCALHENVHSAIVDKAVFLAIEAMKDPRIQTQPMANA